MSVLRDHRLEASIFVFVFGLLAYFYNGWGWNQTARYDPMWAFVEPGPNRYTLRIDDFLTDPRAGVNTGDFAHNPDHGPHYYSNKAPGASLLGIPAYLALYHGERLLGLDPVSPTGALVNAYLLNLWVTVLPVALSAVLFYGLALTLTRQRPRALLLTLLLYAGTLLFPFSTALWGHPTAAAFGIAALACFARPGRRAAALAGLLAGLAVLTDYGAAPLALTLAAAVALGPEGRARLGALALGAAGPVAAFLLYHGLLFGSPFRLASSYSTPNMLDEAHVLGMFGPVSLAAIRGLTFSTVRGVFVFMPALLLGVLTLTRGRDAVPRWLLWLAPANIVAVLLINASYNTWQGGMSAGPRYQIIALPFYVLLLAGLPEGRAARRALYALAGVSFANMLVVAAVSSMAPDALGGSPLLFSWAKLWIALEIDLGITAVPGGGPLSQGSLHFYPLVALRDLGIPLDDPLIGRWGSFNLGERLLGLRGTVSLLPALLGFGGLAAWMARTARREEAEQAPAGWSSPSRASRGVGSRD